MRNVCLRAGVALLCLSMAAIGQYKDAKHGYSFKPPKDYVAVALSPNDHITLAKYQDPQMDYGGEQGYQGYNRQFKISYWPIGRDVLAEDGEDEEDEGEDGGEEGGEGEDDAPPATGKTKPKPKGDEAPAEDELDRFIRTLIDLRFGYCDVTKEKEVTVAGGRGREMILSSSQNPLKIYLLTLDQPDGRWVFEGSAIAQRFDKAVGDFGKAARSFARIEKKDQASHEAALSQLSEQDRFLQKQIDKLPPGWSHLRTKRYLFLYDADKTFVKQMSEQIEGMRNEYERLYPPDKPIEAVSIVRVCKNVDEYRGYGGPPGSGGYWNYRDRELVFFDQSPRSETLCVLNHEAFHQFIYYFYGQLSPHSWYNEGHGDYFSGAKLTKSYRITEYGKAPGGFDRSDFVKEMVRLARQGKRVSEGAAASLKDLTHFSHAEYYDQGGSVRPVAWYPQGWALVHMLREAKGLEPKWQKILPDYLVCLLEAREEVATALMNKTIKIAEKKKAEDGDDAADVEEPSKDVRDYYTRVDVIAVQNLAWDKTFKDWTDEDWDRIQAFFLDYCETL
jgi:hypothetical protein